MNDNKETKTEENNKSKIKILIIAIIVLLILIGGIYVCSVEINRLKENNKKVDNKINDITTLNGKIFKFEENIMEYATEDIVEEEQNSVNQIINGETITKKIIYNIREIGPYAAYLLLNSGKVVFYDSELLYSDDDLSNYVSVVNTNNKKITDLSRIYINNMDENHADFIYLAKTEDGTYIILNGKNSSDTIALVDNINIARSKNVTINYIGQVLIDNKLVDGINVKYLFSEYKIDNDDLISEYNRMYLIDDKDNFYELKDNTFNKLGLVTEFKIEDKLENNDGVYNITLDTNAKFIFNIYLNTVI